MSPAEMATRLKALEDEVARLKARLNGNEQKEPWWVTQAGLFANDPMFDEAMRLGKEYRKSLDRKKKKPRKKLTKKDARP